MNQDNDQILLLPELAEYLRMAPNTIYKWAAAGKIPGIKIGTAWRFRKSVIDAWIESNSNLNTRLRPSR